MLRLCFLFEYWIQFSIGSLSWSSFKTCFVQSLQFSQAIKAKAFLSIQLKISLSLFEQLKAMKVYKFLSGKDDVKFCARVTQALNEGYELYGSPTMTFNGTDVIVGQAIMKDIADESEMPEGLKKAMQDL